MTRPQHLRNGPITRFVKDHYCQVDFAVTVALGAAALIALIKDGHPPESASAWYSALILGLGLGALTNSELITKQRPA